MTQFDVGVTSGDVTLGGAGIIEDLLPTRMIMVTLDGEIILAGVLLMIHPSLIRNCSSHCKWCILYGEYQNNVLSFHLNGERRSKDEN